MARSPTARSSTRWARQTPEAWEGFCGSRTTMSPSSNSTRSSAPRTPSSTSPRYSSAVYPEGRRGARVTTRAMPDGYTSRSASATLGRGARQRDIEGSPPLRLRVVPALAGLEHEHVVGEPMPGHRAAEALELIARVPDPGRPVACAVIARHDTRCTEGLRSRRGLLRRHLAQRPEDAAAADREDADVEMGKSDGDVDQPVERSRRTREVQARALRHQDVPVRIRLTRRHGRDRDAVDVGVLPPGQAGDVMEAEVDETRAQRRRCDGAGHRGCEIAERGGVEMIHGVAGQEHGGQAGESRRRQPERLLLAREEARVEPRIDEEVRRVLLDDERTVHHTGHPEVRVGGVEARLARERYGRARAKESPRAGHDDDEGPEPRHAVPSWRRPSKSTTATAVARFKLRTWGLARGIA